MILNFNEFPEFKQNWKIYNFLKLLVYQSSAHTEHYRVRSSSMVLIIIN